MKTEYALEIVLALITAFTALATTVMNLLFSRRQKFLGAKEKEYKQKTIEHSAISGGMRTLLWIHLDRIYKSSMLDGFISIEDLHTAETIYKSYHALGGNSTGTTVYNKLRKMPNSNPSSIKSKTITEEKHGSYQLYN